MYDRLRAVLDGLDLEWELIFSVDPSPDRTEELILALRERDPRVKMLRFSRRFGQPMATLAGLEAASGDATVVIDCDLQDPPELIPELVARWRDGFDVVYAQRRTRAGETLPKRIVARLGYRVINRIAEVEIPPNTGDFRLMSRRVVDNVVVAQGAATASCAAWSAWSAFARPASPTTATPAGRRTSKYNQFFGSLAIGINGLVGFSRYPLQLISLVGIMFSVLAFLVGDRLPGPQARRRGVPDRQSDDRRRGRLLQRHPAAVARSHGGVRRPDLRRGAPATQVHHRVPLRLRPR